MQIFGMLNKLIKIFELFVLIEIPKGIKTFEWHLKGFSQNSDFTKNFYVQKCFQQNFLFLLRF
jgi:hypothetical protein